MSGRNWCLSMGFSSRSMITVLKLYKLCISGRLEHSFYMGLFVHFIIKRS